MVEGGTAQCLLNMCFVFKLLHQELLCEGRLRACGHGNRENENSSLILIKD